MAESTRDGGMTMTAANNAGVMLLCLRTMSNLLTTVLTPPSPSSAVRALVRTMARNDFAPPHSPRRRRHEG